MKKRIALLVCLIGFVIFLSGLATSRNSMLKIQMNIKDLPEYDLRLISPSDPTFEERLRKELKGTESTQLVDVLRPVSVFLENKSQRPVVAYLIQWCLTTNDGHNQYYRKAHLDPQGLMDADISNPELSRQQGHLEPDSATFLSLLSTDGRGTLRAQVSSDEAEEFKRGKKFDRSWLLQRFSAHQARLAHITVSIDAAFFDDGTFVGPDTTNFFDQTKAVIAARRDLLNEIAVGLSTPDEVYKHVEKISNRSFEPVDSSSKPADYYNYFKTIYAKDVLQVIKLHGLDKALKMAATPLKKPWKTLRKKHD